MLYMRLDSGRFQWPRNAAEARAITRQDYRWLMEGLSIDQPRALRPSQKGISDSALYTIEFKNYVSARFADCSIFLYNYNKEKQKWGQAVVEDHTEALIKLLQKH